MNNKKGKTRFGSSQVRLSLMLFLGFILPHFAMAQSMTVSGTVIGADDNEPLIGVSVQVEGTSRGTITDMDGDFTIEASMGETLQFSYVGYNTVKEKVTGSTMSIKLREDSKMMDEVVVIGYGVQIGRAHV